MYVDVCAYVLGYVRAISSGNTAVSNPLTFAHSRTCVYAWMCVFVGCMSVQVLVRVVGVIGTDFVHT